MSLSIATPSPRPTIEEPSRIRASLARSPLFAGLSLEAIEDLTQRVSVRRVRAHAVVASQEDPGDALHVIMAGRVKAVIFGENGREVTLAILRPGDGFGEVSLFDRTTRSADCIAMEPTTVMSIARDGLLEHMTRYPQTSFNLLSEMARRLRRADDSIAQLALCDVHERLVRKLVHLAQEDGTDVPEGLLMRRRPTQQELANMIGSCRETISRAFNQLAREGVIVPRGRALVVTHELLNRRKNARAA